MEWNKLYYDGGTLHPQFWSRRGRERTFSFTPQTNVILFYLLQISALFFLPLLKGRGYLYWTQNKIWIKKGSRENSFQAWFARITRQGSEFQLLHSLSPYHSYRKVEHCEQFSPLPIHPTVPAPRCPTFHCATTLNPFTLESSPFSVLTLRSDFSQTTRISKILSSCLGRTILIWAQSIKLGVETIANFQLILESSCV